MSLNNDRSPHWFAVAAFSTIALVSITSSFEDGEDLKDMEKETKWAVSAIIVSLFFSALAVFANLLVKDKFVDTLMEGGLALLTAGFWAAVLPDIMDPEHDLAISILPNLGRQIQNPNLYFFSWGSFIMSFYVLFGYLQKRMNLSGVQVFSWAGLAMTSFVTMVAAVRQFDDLSCDNDYEGVLDDKCKRTKLGISVGLISGCIGLAWSFLGRCMKGKLGTMLDLVLTWLVFVMWIFGIIYVAFGGNKAAAPYMGNFYFFTWFSFALSVTMAMTSLKKMMGAEEDAEEEEAPVVQEKVAVPAPEPALEAAVEDKDPVDVEATA